MKILSTADVAGRFGVDISAVRHWLKKGLFPNAQKIARDWVIPESDLKSFKPPQMGRPRRGVKKGR